VHQKGAALGVANTFAYVGIFVGGALGGALYQHFSKEGVALCVMGASVLWFLWILGMRNPGLRANLFLDFEDYDKSKAAQLKGMEGISDFYINETERLIIIKYDSEVLDDETLKAHMKKEA
jgi:hypothetical protein